jgi:hypothetical protein
LSGFARGQGSNTNLQQLFRIERIKQINHLALNKYVLTNVKNMIRLIQGFISVFILLLIAYILIPLFIINEERVQNYASELLGDNYAIEMSSVSWNPVQRTFTSKDIRIVKVEDGESFLEIGEFRIENVDLTAAFGGSLSSAHMIVENFYLDLDKIPDMNGEDDDENGREFEIEIENVKLRGGTVNFSVEDGGKGELKGVDAEGVLNWDSACTECDIYDIINEFHVFIEEVNYLTGNGLYRISGNDIQADESQSGMEISEIRLERLLDDEELREMLDYRQDYFEADLSGLRLDQVNFDAFRNGRDLISKNLNIENLSLHVTSDHNVPEDPESEPSDMPHKALEKLPFRIVVENLKLENGDFRYSEYASGVDRPGSILFARTSADISEIDNRSDNPITINAKSFVMEEGLLEVTFLMQMGQDDLDLNVQGYAEEFDLTLLNEIFMDLEGIVIEDGRLQKLEFEFDMRSDNSKGIVDILYSDLSIDVVNRDDGEQNLVNVLEGFIADRIMVRSGSSSASGESREGEISEERDPDSGFFNYLWSSLRSGLFDAVKRF